MLNVILDIKWEILYIKKEIETIKYITILGKYISQRVEKVPTKYEIPHQIPEK